MAKEEGWSGRRLFGFNPRFYVVENSFFQAARIVSVGSSEHGLIRTHMSRVTASLSFDMKRRGW